MRRRHRAALLPVDRGLQARMVLAMLLTPAVAVGGLAAAIAFGPDWLAFGLVIVVGAGVFSRLRRDDEPPPERPSVSAHQRPELHAAVDRLCLLADLPKPEIVIEYENHPNSWVEPPSRGRPGRLHLTAALIGLLSPAELEAVIAHELSHLAHHDARVLAAVGASGALLLDGAKRGPCCMWGGIAAALVLGWVSRLGTLMLARHRELVADAASASLTGRPVALASALRRISGELALVPSVDLRTAAARDALHLVAVDARELFRPLVLRTHPPLGRRIERLERLERALHDARPS
jgi:heat shock protein HtpX